MYVPHPSRITYRFSHYTSAQRWSFTGFLMLLFILVFFHSIKKLDASIIKHERNIKDMHEHKITRAKAEKELPYLKHHIEQLKKTEAILTRAPEMVITHAVSLIKPDYLVSISSNGCVQKECYKKVGIELKCSGSLYELCNSMHALSNAFCCTPTYLTASKSDNGFEVLSSWAVYLT